MGWAIPIALRPPVAVSSKVLSAALEQGDCTIVGKKISRYQTDNRIPTPNGLVERPTEEDGEMPDEFDDLLSATSHDFRPLLLMALHTGMRRGEIFNLKWEDVDFRTRLLRVRNSKSGEPRQIPLDETLVDTLKDLPSRFAKGYVFPSPQTGGRLTDVKKQFATTVSKAKLENFRFHDLRHTFASHLVMNGVDLVTVATLLGHSSTRMTERYSHLSPAHQTRAVKVLDSAYRSESKTESVEKAGNSESS